jgi:poly(3-hydroxybutyrate) depolymerase
MDDRTGRRQTERNRVLWRRTLLVLLALCVLAPLAIVLTAAPTARKDTVQLSVGRATSSAPPSTAAAPTTAVPTTLPMAKPPYQVQTSSITLTDPTRPTPDRGDVAGHAGRTLVTTIVRPVGVGGRLPVVVFAHGWNSDPAKYATLLDAWAAAGYLVAAPTFPDSADTLPGSPISDYPEQAEDMSFVLTSLLQGVAGPVDPTRVAMAGHSDGGTDVALLALNPDYADHRARAYLCLSGEIPVGVDGTWSAPTPGSLLVAVGTNDEYGLYPNGVQVFQSAAMPKVFVTLTGGDHLDTFIAATPQAVAMRAETVTFLNTAMSLKQPTSGLLGAALQPTPDPAVVVNPASVTG